MPDGKSLLALTDESGEMEFARIPANGVGKEEHLTSGGSILKFHGTPSPDGKHIAWDDNNRDLWVMDLATKQPRKVSENREGIGANHFVQRRRERGAGLVEIDVHDAFGWLGKHVVRLERDGSLDQCELRSIG